MRINSPASAAAGLVLAGVFVGRAAIGVPAEWADRRGGALEADERYGEAISLIDHGAVLADSTDALWSSGRLRIKYWYTLPAGERSGPKGEALLREAAARFLAACAGSPGSAGSTADLGFVYSCREKLARSQRSIDLSTLERGPWSLIGDDARIAIGLARAAVEHQPNSFESNDRLVLLLEEYHLHDDALRAMAEAARVLPDFDNHPDFDFESLPRDLVEAFWSASRAIDPASVPLQLPGEYLLLSAKLGRRLGHLAEAEQDIRRALDLPGTAASFAERAFHLAQVLVDLGRFDEAETMLARAAREPAFEPGVAETRAGIAVKRERWPEALDQLRELRRLKPRELWLLLEFATVAEKIEAWDQADEALRWAILVHPDDGAPRRAMIQLFLARGQKDRARLALDEYARQFGNTDDVIAMERALTGPLDPAGR